MTDSSIRATSSSKTAELCATISAVTHRPCATSITGWARSTAPFSQQSPPDKSATLQTSIRTCSKTAILRLSRCTSAFTKSALPQAYATQSIFSVRNGWVRISAMSKAPQGSVRFADSFLAEVAEIAKRLDAESIERAAALLATVRERGGRLFIIGVGGSAANASHAVNDFRKLAGLEAYAPTDNVSELTARTNDEGWPTVFEAWLHTSRLRAEDLVLVLSVGGGSVDQNVSPNLVYALRYAKQIGTSIIGIVGRDGGFTASVADACVIVPTTNPAHVTPHAEEFQGVI